MLEAGDRGRGEGNREPGASQTVLSPEMDTRNTLAAFTASFRENRLENVCILPKGIVFLILKAIYHNPLGGKICKMAPRKEGQ